MTPPISPDDDAVDDVAAAQTRELIALVAQIGGADAAIAALVDAIRAKREQELDVMQSRGEL